MELGCCLASLDQVPAVEAAGGDYYDLPVARTVMADFDGSVRTPSLTLPLEGEGKLRSLEGKVRSLEGEGSFRTLLSRAATFGLKPRAYNVFLPSDLPVTGPAVDRERIEAYVRAALERVDRLGGHLVGFGSGPARSVPDGFSRGVALQQLEDFLRSGSDRAAEYRITLAVEPLRRAESNIFNSVRECAAFIRERRLDKVALVADYYHMMEEEESLDSLNDCSELLAHVQVADSGRQPPGLGSYDLAGFLRRLREIGYRGDCSIECRWSDFSNQIGPAMHHLRQAAITGGWGRG